MIEVELKAWVDDPAGLEAALAARFRFMGSYRKEDVYYRLERPAAAPAGSVPAGPSAGARAGGSNGPQLVEFRLRIENGAAYVTCKEKQIAGGIEVNRETEFEVSDPAAFDSFARFIGAHPFVRKVKVGRRYAAYPDQPTANRGAGAGRAVKATRAGASVHLELSEVERLGFFIEIEKLIESDDPAEVATAREEVRWLLESLGIGASKIEPRYYIDMLAAVERGEQVERR